jgi:hypothetical protein
MTAVRWPPISIAISTPTLRACGGRGHERINSRVTRVDGQTFRDRFTCRGDRSGFAELYLHKQRVIVEVLRARMR